MKQITDIADARLVKGLAHPVRVEILRVLDEGIASPSELAERIGAPLGNVSYHVRFLARIGLIELHDTQQRRGAVEHYYRIVPNVRVTDDAWAQLPRAVRDTVLSTTLDEVGRSVGAAVAAGGFDHHTARASRLEFTLDCDGFAALSVAVGELHERAAGIERESRARIAQTAAQVARREGKAAIDRDGRAAIDSDARAAVAGDDALRAQLVLMLFDSTQTPAAG